MRGPSDIPDDPAGPSPAAGQPRAPGSAQPDSTQPGSAQPGRLKRRADFLRVGRGRRWHGKAMTVQSAPQDGAGEARVGFTLTRKVGCAVVRNRARRRLREAVRSSPELPLRFGNDYVIVGRLEAIRLPFAELKRELARAVAAVHRPASSGQQRDEGRPGGKGRDVRRRGKGDGRPGAPAAGPLAADGADPDGAGKTNSAKSAGPSGRTLERTESTP